jgi:hypothetical protein
MLFKCRVYVEITSTSEAYVAQLASTPRSAATIAFDALSPGFAASINEVPPLRRPSADTSAGDVAARTRFPGFGEMLDTEFNGLPRRCNTIVDEVSAPRNATFIGVASTSQLNARTPGVVSTDFAQSEEDYVRASLVLTEEGSATHSSIKAALAFLFALIADHYHKIEISGNAAREDARIINALLKRLKTSTHSNDDDDGNNTPEEAARNDLIR